MKKVTFTALQHCWIQGKDFFIFHPSGIILNFCHTWNKASVSKPLCKELCHVPRWKIMLELSYSKYESGAVHLTFIMFLIIFHLGTKTATSDLMKQNKRQREDCCSF